jgi:hypothetical protein
MLTASGLSFERFWFSTCSVSLISTLAFFLAFDSFEKIFSMIGFGVYMAYQSVSTYLPGAGEKILMALSGLVEIASKSC